jgi:hypothetical protein
MRFLYQAELYILLKLLDSHGCPGEVIGSVCQQFDNNYPDGLYTAIAWAWNQVVSRGAK